MRNPDEIHINEDLSGQDLRKWPNGADRGLVGYYRNTNLRNVDISGSIVNAVLVNSPCNDSDWEYADIQYLSTPKDKQGRITTLTDVKFKKPLINAIAHKVMGSPRVGKIMGWNNAVYNHVFVSEQLRQYALANLPNNPFRRKCLTYIKKIADRTDLSWAELSRIAPDDVIKMGFHVFKDVPELNEKILLHRPELEPEEIKLARLSISTK